MNHTTDSAIVTEDSYDHVARARYEVRWSDPTDHRTVLASVEIPGAAIRSHSSILERVARSRLRHPDESYGLLNDVLGLECRRFYIRERIPSSKQIDRNILPRTVIAQSEVIVSLLELAMIIGALERTE